MKISIFWNTRIRTPDRAALSEIPYILLHVNETFIIIYHAYNFRKRIDSINPWLYRSVIYKDCIFFCNFNWGASC